MLGMEGRQGVSLLRTHRGHRWAERRAILPLGATRIDGGDRRGEGGRPGLRSAKAAPRWGARRVSPPGACERDRRCASPRRSLPVPAAVARRPRQRDRATLPIAAAERDMFLVAERAADARQEPPKVLAAKSITSGRCRGGQEEEAGLRDREDPLWQYPPGHVPPEPGAGSLLPRY